MTAAEAPLDHDADEVGFEELPSTAAQTDWGMFLTGVEMGLGVAALVYGIWKRAK